MSKQLSKADWIQHGFNVLKTEGPSGLKADRMVRDLKVSRGSFYWHFENVAAFEAELLSAWQREITDRQIAELKKLGSAPDQLTELISRIFTIPQALEASIRHWADRNETVADAVRRVDRIRVEYLTGLLQRSGLAHSDAQARASILVWTYTGRALAPELLDGMDKDAAKRLAALFCQKTEMEGQ